MSLSAQYYLDELLQRYPALAGQADAVNRAVDLICDCHTHNGKVLVCGNGGSAADSEHIVGELMKGFILKRPVPAADRQRLQDAGYDDWDEMAGQMQQGIPAVALTAQSAIATAVLNDLSPEMVFGQQVYALGKPGDVLIGLSTSGNSRNVVKALQVARAFGLVTIGFTGEMPARMDDYCDVILKAPATETFKVQEYHLPLYHAICAMVEARIFGGVVVA